MRNPTPKAEPSIVTPEFFHRYMASRASVSPDELRVSSGLLFTYHHNMFHAARRRIRGRYIDWYYGGRRLVEGSLKGVKLAALQPTMGSAMAGTMLEEMIASGARYIVEVGICGGLAPNVKIGDIVVADKAFVDEGTSAHYFKQPTRFAGSSKITSAIKDALTEASLPFKVGGMWTTDAPYRETRAKFWKFQKLGALGVNMESSAIMAIARYRKAELGSIQIVSDLLGKKDWRPAFHEKVVSERSLASVMAALDALVKM